MQDRDAVCRLFHASHDVLLSTRGLLRSLFALRDVAVLGQLGDLVRIIRDVRDLMSEVDWFLSPGFLKSFPPETGDWSQSREALVSLRNSIDSLLRAWAVDRIGGGYELTLAHIETFSSHVAALAECDHALQKIEPIASHLKALGRGDALDGERTGLGILRLPAEVNPAAAQLEWNSSADTLTFDDHHRPARSNSVIAKDANRKRMTAAEAEILAGPIIKSLERRGKRVTQRELAKLIGCSWGMVPKLLAYQAYRLRHPEYCRTLTAVSLDPKFHSSAMTVASPAKKTAALKRLIGEQRRDDRRNRVHSRQRIN